MLTMGMESREELSVAQDKNETLNGFGVRLVNICWVSTVYKHWAKDLGPRKTLMVWTSRPQRGNKGAGEAGGDASKTLEEEIISFHTEANRRAALGSLTSSLDRTHR